MPPLETKERILDAAEALFGRHGVDATSLRLITTEADVNLAAVNYHFQSKDSLVAAVFERRVVPINLRRMELLDVLEARGEGTPLPIEEILHAMTAPLLESADLDRFGPMMARMLLAEPPQNMRSVIRNSLLPVVTRFTRLAHRALPHLTLQELAIRLHFSFGAILHTLTAAYSPLEEFDLQAPPRNPRQALPQLIAYVAAGLRAPSLRARARKEPS